MYGATLRCPVCNHYHPDRCTCRKDPALKGKEGGNCNRTTCQQPHALYFNVGTNAYYCYECAKDINDFAMNVRDGSAMNLFPDFANVRVKQLNDRANTRAERMLHMDSYTAQASYADLERRVLAIMQENAKAVSAYDVTYLDHTITGKRKAQWKTERKGRR